MDGSTKNLVYTEKIEKNFGKILRKAFENRTISDYDAFVEFEKEDVAELYDEMKLFVERIETFLKPGK